VLGRQPAGARSAVLVVARDHVPALRIHLVPLQLHRHVLFLHEHRLAHGAQVLEIHRVVGRLDPEAGIGKGIHRRLLVGFCSW
jgi:hypothetical protein